MAGPVPEEFICSANDLVTLPGVARRFAGLADGRAGDGDADDISRLARWDPALTARLLAAANDGQWGQSGLVDSVDAAVAVLGARRTRALAAGLPTLRTFPGIPVSIATMDGCWGASIRVAVAAREIAQQCGNGRAEVVFVAGLLHDVGRLVMLLQSPQSFLLGRETSRRATAGRPTEARVRGRWPPDPARVGAALLSAWRLPACLQSCVAHRHQPERAAGFRTEAAIVHVAHGLAVLAAADSEDFRDAPPIAPAAWSRVGIGPERGLAILPAVREQADEARRLFDA